MTMSKALGTLSSVDRPGRTVSGVCVPYLETSRLVPNPYGERVLPGAFASTTRQPATKVFLYRGHDHQRPVGHAVEFHEEPGGLVGTFVIRDGDAGDETLRDLVEGYLPGMSVGFKPVQIRRGSDGATEVVEAMLKEVSLVSLPAYDGARVLALRDGWMAGRRLAPMTAVRSNVQVLPPRRLYVGR